MKKLTIYCAAALLLLSGCAKTPASGTNDAAKVYFDAWLEINKTPDWVKTPLGCYITGDEPGTGTEVVTDTTGNRYLWVEYTATTLEGSLSTYTDALSAHQMNAFHESYYFGPRIWQRGENTLYAGVEDAVIGMKEGGSRSFVMPAWLGSYSRYADEAQYLSKATGTAGIYSVRLVKVIPDLVAWETDSLRSYYKRNFPSAGDEPVEEGLYYVCRHPRSNDLPFTADSTYYINYIGRCLDGRVFDTNIRDTAVFYGIWNSSRTYGPTAIKWATTADKITMGSSSVITGFAKTLLQMGRYEAGTGIFVSSMGYKGTGSGNTIPPFSPLRFDIEFCDKQ